MQRWSEIEKKNLRDQTERNYPIADVLYRYEAHVLPAFKKYIEPHRETSDIIINNNEHFDLGVEMVEAFILRKLGSIELSFRASDKGSESRDK